VDMNAPWFKQETHTQSLQREAFPGEFQDRFVAFSCSELDISSLEIIREAFKGLLGVDKGSSIS
jgi:hypothetical protein